MEKLPSKEFPDNGKDGHFGIIAETGKLKGIINAPSRQLPPIIVKFYPSCNCIAGPVDKVPDYCPTHGTPPIPEVIK